MSNQEKQKHLLLIEDDPNLGMILQEALELKGYQITLCRDGEEGLEAFKKGGFHLCLVDVMLPKKDGFEVGREIRKRDDHTPLIFLTAKAMKEDRISGLKIGADDYVTKPFSMEELGLRIQAVLKRSSGPAIEQSGRWTLGDYVFDAGEQVLTFQGTPQKLTYKESELLRLLCRQLNRILPREAALEIIWGDAGFFQGRSMDVYISKLRKYLSGDPRIEIVNVHGKGFKLMLKM